MLKAATMNSYVVSTVRLSYTVLRMLEGTEHNIQKNYFRISPKLIISHN